jgi:hypothetical protein
VYITWRLYTQKTAFKTNPLDPETNGTNIDSLTLFVLKAQGTTHSSQA